MLIVADENIPLLDEFFAGFGEIRRLPGRVIDAAAVRNADALLVRSVTPVSRELLAQSKVGFVGTCTIGTDHLDIEHFSAAGMTWRGRPSGGHSFWRKWRRWRCKRCMRRGTARWTTRPRR